MIQQQTYLNVADNTGAKKIMCIRILGNNRRVGKIGDVLIGVVKQSIPNMAIKRSAIVRAVIVRTKKELDVKMEQQFALVIMQPLLSILKITQRELEYLDLLQEKFVKKILVKLFR